MDNTFRTLNALVRTEKQRNHIKHSLQNKAALRAKRGKKKFHVMPSGGSGLVCLVFGCIMR
jgi:hypothetical protein